VAVTRRCGRQTPPRPAQPVGDAELGVAGFGRRPAGAGCQAHLAADGTQRVTLATARSGSYPSHMRSKERSGSPSALRDHAMPVWVELGALFCSGSGPAATVSDGLVINQPCAGGLHRWLRSSTGEWIGLVTYVVALADGTTYKAEDQLVPAHALRQR
jgi:hypothetical protein